MPGTVAAAAARFPAWFGGTAAEFVLPMIPGVGAVTSGFDAWTGRSSVDGHQLTTFQRGLAA